MKIDNKIKKILDNLTKEEVIWANEYLSAKIDDSSCDIPNKSLITDKITIIYATETGNSKKIAIDLSNKLKSFGVKIKLKAIEQYKFSDIIKEEYFIIVASTHGEGELPEPAYEFYENLDKNPDLSKIKYTILALGDSNYSLFCESGRIFDKKFKELGAKEFLNILELDLDWEEYIDEWQNNIIQNLEGGNSSPKKSSIIVKKKKSKIKGEIIENITLNDEGSNKEIHHIEISAPDIDYLPGDSIGIKIGDNSPRLYSIASSLDESEDEVHITVAKVKDGLCSTYLSDLKIGDKVELYVSKNSSFKLPNDESDIIMIGPGTGIAPFRAFLSQRNYNNSSGKNWLFFGAQYQHLDFLYQSELLEYLDSSLLTNLSLAFSRDQNKKIYVQNRIKENSDEIKKWIQNGAYIYICGDKANMAKDVENSLIDIIGNDLFNKMKDEDRYLLDVY